MCRCSLQKINRQMGEQLFVTLYPYTTASSCRFHLNEITHDFDYDYPLWHAPVGLLMGLLSQRTGQEQGGVARRSTCTATARLADHANSCHKCALWPSLGPAPSPAPFPQPSATRRSALPPSQAARINSSAAWQAKSRIQDRRLERAGEGRRGRRCGPPPGHLRAASHLTARPHRSTAAHTSQARRGSPADVPVPGW